MDQRLLALRRTIQTGAATRDSLILTAHDRRTTDGTGNRHHELGRQNRTPLGQDAYHFGNHVAGPADNDRIANPHVLAPDFVLVVQRGIGHRNSADEHRLEPGHRRQRAGPANLDVDTENFGACFFSRVFVGYGPTWLTRNETKLGLQCERVDLIHHAIDVERQFAAFLADAPVKIGQRLRAAQHGAFGTNRQAEGRQSIEDPGMGIRPLPALHLPETVGEKRQRPAGRHFRIELADTAGRTVARIDQRFLAGRLRLLIEAFEIGALHVDFAAHFEHRGWHRSPQAERNLPDRPHIGSDVLARLAVAACRRLNQHTRFVAKIDGQTVEFQFGGIFHRRIALTQTEFLAYPHVKGKSTAVAVVGLGADRKHRHDMRHRPEHVERLATDPQGRRVRRPKFWMRRLDRLQLAKQTVVFRIRNQRRIENVILMVVLFDFPTQAAGLFGDVHAAVLRKTGAWPNRRRPAVCAPPSRTDTARFAAGSAQAHPPKADAGCHRQGRP